LATALGAGGWWRGFCPSTNAASSNKNLLPRSEPGGPPRGSRIISPRCSPKRRPPPRRPARAGGGKPFRSRAAPDPAVAEAASARSGRAIAWRHQPEGSPALRVGPSRPAKSLGCGSSATTPITLSSRASPSRAPAGTRPKQARTAERQAAGTTPQPCAWCRVGPERFHPEPLSGARTRRFPPSGSSAGSDSGNCVPQLDADLGLG